MEVVSSAVQTGVPRLMSADEISFKNTKSQTVKIGDVSEEIQVDVSVLTVGTVSGVGGGDSLVKNLQLYYPLTELA